MDRGLENLRFLRQLAQTEGFKRYELGAPGVDLTGMNLSGLDLTGLDMNKVNFSHVTADALLTNNPEYQIRTQEDADKVKGIRRSARMQLNSTNWDHAILGWGVDFGGSQMQCASFREATVPSLGTNLNFSSSPDTVVPTDLRNADLRGIKFAPFRMDSTPYTVGMVMLDNADVRGVDFRSTVLDDVYWATAFFDDSTLWPNGYKPPLNGARPEEREEFCEQVRVSPYGKFEF